MIASPTQLGSSLIASITPNSDVYDLTSCVASAAAALWAVGGEQVRSLLGRARGSRAPCVWSIGRRMASGWSLALLPWPGPDPAQSSSPRRRRCFSATCHDPLPMHPSLAPWPEGVTMWWSWSLPRGSAIHQDAALSTRGSVSRLGGNLAGEHPTTVPGHPGSAPKLLGRKSIHYKK